MARCWARRLRAKSRRGPDLPLHTSFPFHLSLHYRAALPTQVMNPDAKSGLCGTIVPLQEEAKSYGEDYGHEGDWTAKAFTRDVTEDRNSAGD
jgi:hypothetical protein